MTIIRAWNSFWFRPTSARPLGAIRILFGLVALANLALLAVDLDYWCSDAGLLQGVDSREVAGPLRYSPLQTYQDPATVRAVFAATSVAATLLTVGLWTRAASVLFYLGMLAIHHRNLTSTSGADVLLMTFAFHLLLTNSGRAYSVDAWRESRRRGGTIAEPIVWPIAQRLIQIQICIVYAIAAAFKCAGWTWMHGTALHFVLFNTEVRRLDVLWLADYPELINLATYGSLALEFALVFLLWVRPARKWVILAGIALHVGICFVINIPVFGELMMIGYLAYLSPEEWDGLVARLDPRRLVPAWAGRSLGAWRSSLRLDVPALSRELPEGQPVG